MIEDITAEDFLVWANENPQDWKRFYDDEISDHVFMLEQEDYFGTEGFNKRFE